MQPQIIGFGAHKAGTTWLHDNLVTNPGVWGPPLKEMHYFTHRMTGNRWMMRGHRERLRGRRDLALSNGMTGKAAYFGRLLKIPMLSEEWYRAVYNRCPVDRQSLDITPAYALLDEDTLRYMNCLLGDQFKAIYLIRDPASRIISAVKSYAAAAGRKGSTIEFWLEHVTQPAHRLRSDYQRTVNLLDEQLGDRVLYLPFGRLRTDPVNVLREVEAHCCLPEGDYQQPEKAKHVSPLVVLPEGLYDAVQILLRKQYNWLEQRFDRSFLVSV